MSIRFCVKVYNTPDFCRYWLSTKLHWTKTSSTTSRIGISSTFLFCLSTFFLTVCYCHVTYGFQSEFILYSWLDFKKLLVRSKRKIWSLSDSNWIWTQNHLVLKRTLNYLAKLTKWLSCVLSTYLYGAFDCMFLSPYVRVSEWINTL